MKDNDGYIKVVSVMQKFFDQGISGNWSYNPENYILETRNWKLVSRITAG